MRFAARILRLGRSHNDVRWPRQLGWVLAALLSGCPVRAFHDGRHFRHPHDADLGDRGVIGSVASATAHGVEVLAALDIHDERIVAGLVALERERKLASTIGLSVMADVLYTPTWEMGRPVRHVTAIDAMTAVDLVSDPSAEGCVLCSLSRVA